MSLTIHAMVVCFFLPTFPTCRFCNVYSIHSQQSTFLWKKLTEPKGRNSCRQYWQPPILKKSPTTNDKVLHPQLNHISRIFDCRVKDPLSLWDPSPITSTVDVFFVFERPWSPKNRILRSLGERQMFVKKAARSNEEVLFDPKIPQNKYTPED